MTRISLRSYDKEIESMIDHGQTIEAIAHCAQILRQYPKHVDTYRLLGKAYLESRQYSDASDVLQRVLSVVPDDFVANLGMSIIREDEKNLDSAIWHMERAFEFQPSNPAIQNELQRLRTRRDGVEPPKVRLTRGALVRMYERGHLYPQAIAEIKAALAEDPKRVDLLVILARLYYLSDQKMEAIETSGQIISQSPYNLEANRILVEILPAVTQTNEYNVYKQRLTALDPYYSYVTSAIPSINLVPDSAVMVEKMELDGSRIDFDQSQWIQNLDMPSTESASDDFPDIKDVAHFPPSESEETPAFDWSIATEKETVQGGPSPRSDATNIIPDWMANAGWNMASSPDKSTDSPSDSSGEEKNKNILPAEIPDWIQSMAPSPLGAGLIENMPETAGDSKEINFGEFEFPPESEDQNPDDEETLEQSIPEAENEAEFSTIQANKNLETALEANMSDFIPKDNPPNEEGLPDWLKNLSDDELKETVQPDNSPGFEEPSNSSKSSSEFDETMAWLESLAARNGASEETLTTPAENREDTLPDWISDIQAGSKEGDLDFEEKSQPAETNLVNQLETQPSENILDHDSDSFRENFEDLAQITDEEIPQITEKEEALEASNIDNQMDHILSSLRNEEEFKSAGQEEESERLEPPQSAGEAEKDLTFLETSISINETENLLTDQIIENPKEAVPSWVADFSIPLSSDQPSIIPVSDEELRMSSLEKASDDSEGLPDWLKEVLPSEEALSEEPASSLPDWLMDEKEEISPLNEIDRISPAVPPISDETIPGSTQGERPEEEDNELPDWLKELEQQPSISIDDISSESMDMFTGFTLPTENREPIAEEKPGDNIVISKDMRIPTVESSENLPGTESADEELEVSSDFIQNSSSPLAMESAEVGEETLPQADESNKPPETEWKAEILDTPSLSSSAEEIFEPAPMVEEKIEKVKALFDQANVDDALDEVNNLLKTDVPPDRIVDVLKEALDRHPVHVDLWQTYGDALAKNNQLQDALDAYTKAEELVK